MTEPQQEGESLLFESLKGDVIPDEQLQNWHLLNSQIDDLILDPYSTDKDIDLALLLSSEAQKDDLNLEASTSGTLDTSVASCSNDTHITTKYLRGELNFLQFSEMMEKMQSDEGTSAPHKKIAATTSSVDNDDDVSLSDDGDASDITWEPATRKKRKTPRRRKHDIPKDLVGLMGEANLQYARGCNAEAMKMCLEIIRLSPLSSEPFRMLAMIYDEMGNTDKSLQYSLIAAHLQPDDPEEWVRLAQISLESGDPKQALACYTKASKYDNTNLSLVLEKCHLMESLGQDKKALETYIHVLHCLPDTDGSSYFLLARNLCRAYHDSNRDDKAIEALTLAFDMHPQEITSEDVNHLVELQIGQKCFNAALLILMENCDIHMYSATGDEVTIRSDKDLRASAKNVTRCTVSELLPLDLRVKLIVCLLQLNIHSPVDDLVQPLFDEDWEENGDVPLDVAEAYMAVGLYHQAQPILHRLIYETRYFGMAAVWLTYAECLNAVGEVGEAMEAYKQVVTLAPHHVSARVSLSALQQQLGKTDEAIQTLSKDEFDGDTASASEILLLIHKCHVLYTQERWEDYLEACKQVILFHIPEKDHPPMRDASGTDTPANKRKMLMADEILSSINKKDFKNIKGISKVELFDLYKKASSVLMNSKRYTDLLNLSLCAMTNPAFIYDASILSSIDEMAMNSCLLSKNSVYGYKYIRNRCIHNPDNSQLWNLFCQMLQYSTDSRHQRFCLRLNTKYPSNMYLNILNGHISTISGSYKHALGEYTEAYKRIPHDPMLSLCMGLMFLHMCMQKYATQRHWLVAQGMAFLAKYIEKRGECQEVYYNMGRAMHQLGLLYVATYYYKKALTFGPAVPSEPEVFDMSRQIAFNLALLYKDSGCVERAQLVLQQYCVV